MKDVGIAAADNLPFNEMVDRVPITPGQNAGVDVLLVTGGGSAQQVNLFVDSLRRRFPDSVEFLIPYKAMSAGTLWALSGDRIWMDERAFLGPIDPQVPGKDGRLVPAQSLLTLIKQFQDEGQAALAGGRSPDWTHIQILKEIDARQLGQAINSSAYSINMAKEYLARYKLRRWGTHKKSQIPVTDDERKAVALAAATALCQHERWKTHGHAITRDVIGNELELEIDRPEEVPELHRALRRMWALLYYLLDRTHISKVMFSQAYKYARVEQHHLMLGKAP